MQPVHGDHRLNRGKGQYYYIPSSFLRLLGNYDVTYVVIMRAFMKLEHF